MQSLTELSPVGILEEMFAQEIVRLVARLERTDLTDAERSSTTISLRRDMAELRYLQTDRRLKFEHNLDLPGLISAKEILRFRKLVAKLAKETGRPDPQSGSALTGIEADGADSGTVKASEGKLHALIVEEEKKQLADFTKGSQYSQGQGTQYSSALSPKKMSGGMNSGRSPQKPSEMPDSGRGSQFMPHSGQVPRNAPCPCRSGHKYKRCCGLNAPPVLSQAA